MLLTFIPEWLWQSWVDEIILVYAAWTLREYGATMNRHAIRIAVRLYILRTEALEALTRDRDTTPEPEHVSAPAPRPTVAQTFVELAPKIADVMRDKESHGFRVTDTMRNFGTSFETPKYHTNFAAGSYMQRMGIIGFKGAYNLSKPKIETGFAGVEPFNFYGEHKPVSSWSAIEPYSFFGEHKPLHGWQSGIISGITPPK